MPSSEPSDPRPFPLRWRSWGPLLAALALATAAQGAGPRLSLEQMTFVLAEDDRSELVLTAAAASLEPRSSMARLRDVRLRMAGGPGRPRFEARCPAGELDLRTRDFEALGAVEGLTGDGRRFRAESLRYRHADRRFESDDAITIDEGGGRIEAGGFRYSLRERSFRLIGGSRVVMQRE